VIAGGTGFLGRNLAAHLTDSGWNVLVLSRSEELDGPCGGAAAPDRSRAGAVRPVLRVAASSRRGLRVQFPDLRATLADLYSSARRV